MKHSNIAIFVPHIGCPRQCSFCNQHTITGGAKAPAPQYVEETCATAAAHLKERAATAQIAFFGGSFTAVPRDYMLSLLKPAHEAVKRFGFAGIRCSTRPDAIDEEILEILAEHSVTAIELGAQSMSDEVLAKNRRGHTALQTEQAARLINSHRFELGLQMMTGLYGDTDETAMLTAEKIIELNPKTARIYPTVVLPHTMLAELYSSGEYKPQTLDEAVDLCAKLLPKFENAGVQVIRMGLHAENDVEQSRLAGPYHPAFRELVESRIFLNELLPALAGHTNESVTTYVNPKTISVALGERKSNLNKLEKLGYNIVFKQNNTVERGKFALEIM